MKQSKMNAPKIFAKGFLKVPNAVLENIYSDNPLTRLQGKLFLCLLHHAYFKIGMSTINSLYIPCRRGEWITTYRIIEEKTGISRCKLNMLLDLLANDGLITVKRFVRFTVITINRYDDLVSAPVALPPVLPAKTGTTVVPDILYNRLTADIQN